MFLLNITFYLGTSLTTIAIPNSVASIERHFLAECTSLISITIPDSVISIGSYFLSGCTSLTSITIPLSVTSIGDYFLSECYSLNSVTFLGSSPPHFEGQIDRLVSRGVHVVLVDNE